MFGQTTTSSSKTHAGVQVSLAELLDLQLRARELLMPVRHMIKQQRAGGHLSSVRGRGMDFEEVRHYSPGDDVRAMDWRVTARSNEPHIKLYREERERPMIVMVDFSSTMFFGTKVAFKSVVAAKAAALLAWTTVLAGDRVGGVLFNETMTHANAPRARQQAMLPMLKALAQFSQLSDSAKLPRSEGAIHTLASELARLRRVAPAGALVVILSDFEQADYEVKRHLQQLAQHHPLIAGLIYDPLEQVLPDIGQCAFTDGHSRLLMNSSSNQVRARYHQQFSLKAHDIQQFMMRQGQSFFQLATNQPILPVLREVLQHSEGIHR